MEAAVGAPETPGVHVVVDGGTVVYVGYTENLRNRLRQHLTGNRAPLADRPCPTATVDELPVHRLGGCRSMISKRRCGPTRGSRRPSPHCSTAPISTGRSRPTGRT
ncbi:GIY-YIG nuclease family protein [Micromonospora rosaria]|uniref:GIY-YIG nuclease family protein n=1 Tax=Micromonospora rosaria TaxID=47874 RepID=UPI0037C6C51D